MDSRRLDDGCRCGTTTGVWACGVTPPIVISDPTPSPTVSEDLGTPANCTGDPAIDAVLSIANLATASGLTASPVYTWAGFCGTLRKLREVGTGTYTGSSLAMFLGDPSSSNPTMARDEALVNIAGLLSQCMWESGGESPWSSCDENNHQNIPTAACSQRTDGTLYNDLTSPISCDIDLEMRMTAETHASWTSGPLECAPGTVTEGCCWWGRGAIQTTGPHNYAALQRDVLNNIDEFRDTVDLCTNPEALCQDDELKWVGAVHYWTTVVQQEQCFRPTLTSYAGSDNAPVSGCFDFSSGVGGSINNGNWNSHAWRIRTGQLLQLAHGRDSRRNRRC